MKTLLFIIPLGIFLTAIIYFNNTESAIESTTVEVTTQQTETIKEDVSVEKFTELIAKNDGQILDVRTPEEWESGIIKGATKMNFFDANFADQLKELNKDKPVYVYCKSGGRSGKAATKMHEMGFTQVYNLIGGIGAWDAAGKEKVK